jgi:hypothetical protein
MKKILCILLIGLLINTIFSEETILEDYENHLFGYNSTVWVHEGSNENYKYFYSLDFEYYSVPHPYKIRFSYFTQRSNQGPPKIKVFREGVFEITNNIVKIDFTKAFYDVWNTFDYEPVLENLSIELEIEIVSKEIANKYAEIITIKQIAGKNIFEDFNDHEPITFRASRIPSEQ